MSSFCWQFSCWNGWAAVGWNRIWPFFSWSVSTYKVLLKIRHRFQVINFYCRECCIKKQAKELTDEHTALCLFTRSKFSCSCGLPQFFIHRLHFSSSVFGLGNKINRPPFSRSGYLSSALHVPHAQRKTISCYELATRTISWHVCGTRWRPLTLFLVIGWYSHC